MTTPEAATRPLATPSPAGRAAPRQARLRRTVGPLAVVLVCAGLVAFKRLPIEAYPNPVPPLVEVIAQPPGWSAEETER